MLFNSLHFFIFFIAVSVLYFLLPHRYRWLLLLLASCYFYMAFIPIYIVILLFTIVVDYFIGIYLETATKYRKAVLVCSLVVNIGILWVFKYYNFVNDNISLLLQEAGINYHFPSLSMLLPVGLSFHTFQAMSYNLEIYRGNQRPERSFGIYALFVMFYPQLVAGPIERPQNLLHQFHEKHSVNIARIAEGLKRVIWGLFKKMVIADRIAYFVNTIYGDLHHYTGSSLLLAIVLFPIQIYCDFSGYSDIALGSAQVMGFKLMENFNLPFLSKSVSEFWRRWHISLSTWFNDYLFNPMLISFRHWGKNIVLIALFITFFLSGLWHGASWHFVIYGCVNGIALMYEAYTIRYRKKVFKKLPQALNNVISNILTLAFLALAWVLFRAKDMDDAMYIFTHLFQDFFRTFSPALSLILDKKPDTLISVVCIFILLYREHWRHNTSSRTFPWVFYQSLVLTILFFGEFDSSQDFIYFHSNL